MEINQPQSFSCVSALPAFHRNEAEGGLVSWKVNKCVSKVPHSPPLSLPSGSQSGHELEASRGGEETTDILMINLATDGKSRGEMTVSIPKKIKSNYRTF